MTAILFLALLPSARLDQPVGTSLPSTEPRGQIFQLGPLRVTQRITHGSPLVSDVVTLSYEVEAPAGIEVKLRTVADAAEDLQIRNARQAGPAPGPAGSELWKTLVDIEALSPGTYRLPALEVQFRDSPDSDWTTGTTDPPTLEFRSVLGDAAEAAEPKPNPGPLSLPRRPPNWRVIAVLGLTVLVLAALAVLALIYWPRKPLPVPRVSAYRKAMLALDDLERRGWLRDGQFDPFYTALSGIVRHYVEDRFGLRAPERTTEEFLHELAIQPVLAGDRGRALGHFLEQCDLVKFARFRPAAAEGQAALEAARRFIESTRDDSVFVLASES
jgi:hypothetical protein